MSAPVPDRVSATIRITSIRSNTRKGCIAFGHRVDLATGNSDRSNPIVVSLSASIAEPSTIAVGGIYDVYGEVTIFKRSHDKYIISDTQIEAQSIQLVRPSGSQIIQWLSDNARGISNVKATKLWDTLGDRLYEALDSNDDEALKLIIPNRDLRTALFDKWFENGDARTLRFVQEKNIPLDLARKAIKFHKKNTIQALIADPYRLLSFEGSWTRVDEISKDKFGITLDDPRRLAAAVEEALYRVAEKGSTCATLNDIQATVGMLIKPYSAVQENLVKALLLGKETGQFVSRETNNSELMLHAPGTYLMERQCAEFIKILLQNPNTQNQLPINIDALIGDFELEERRQQNSPAFVLNEAQRMAIKTSFSNRFSIITGGAGVGKTTVLKALYKVLDTLGRPRFQMALAGRATARMIEATKQPATTIASFLHSVSAAEIGPAPVIVIDEASMLDLLTFHRLVCKLPVGTHLILVGDPYQLPPIGAGLILHVLCNLPGMPSTQLTEAKRQAKESVIPAAAKAIREGQWPTFTSDTTAELVFLPCADAEIIPTVMRLYDDEKGKTQILGATRSCPFAGVDTINRACHVKYASHAKPLLIKNSNTGEVEATGFCEGDFLLYTANDWQRNLQNGCLGRLIKVFDEPRKVNLGGDGAPIMRQAVGVAVFDGISQYILDTDVDLIDYAYAITVHKAQGSQFQRVIVPVRRSRVLDRTFVYTAVTRAQVQVILVGDSAAIRAAIIQPPKAFSRKVGLGEMLMP